MNLPSLPFKGTYQEENLFSILEEAIPRLTNIGIPPERIHSTIGEKSTDLRQKEDNQELNIPIFSALETLIIGREVFKELALEQANIIFNLIKNSTNKYVSKLFQKFETLALEIYYFNEFLPQEYKINFDMPWQKYLELRNIPQIQIA